MSETEMMQQRIDLLMDQVQTLTREKDRLLRRLAIMSKYVEDAESKARDRERSRLGGKA